MKNILWTQTLFESYNYIATIARTIDKRVMSLGVNSYKTTDYGQDCTMELMETVIELIERKKKILRLKLLIEDTLRNVSVETAKIIIRKYIDKLSLKDLALEMRTNVSTVRRRLKKALIECYEYFCKQGYCVQYIEQEYIHEKWLIGIYERKYSNQKKPREADRVIYIPQKSNSSFSVCFSI